MFCLKRDAGLTVNVTSELATGDVENVRGGLCRVCRGGAGEDNCRVVNGETMKLMLPIRRRLWLGRARIGSETKPDRKTGWFGGETGGVGRGLLWGQPSPVG